MFKSNCSRGSINVPLSGGFGNQLFELANGLEQSLLTRRPIRIIAPQKGWAFALDKLGLQQNFTYNPTLSNDSISFELVEPCISCKFDIYQEKNFSFKRVKLKI